MQFFDFRINPKMKYTNLPFVVSNMLVLQHNPRYDDNACWKLDHDWEMKIVDANTFRVVYKGRQPLPQKYLAALRMMIIWRFALEKFNTTLIDEMEEPEF